jgi:hypothetical protein
VLRRPALLPSALRRRLYSRGLRASPLVTALNGPAITWPLVSSVAFAPYAASLRGHAALDGPVAALLAAAAAAAAAAPPGGASGTTRAPRAVAAAPAAADAALGRALWRLAADKAGLSAEVALGPQGPWEAAAQGGGDDHNRDTEVQ